ncbi:uncharacterized protein C9orf85 homolog [Condylostylus longicornis]|uniref:uncharacterized protein C9orf85 homolog n=1 Tax=Condylostylus longicornis TaxID=2530218 RepID=UPI00244E08CF|nr:uncharacterized protein C9orf85 homolog [Condylostylus longicornis]
MSTSKGSTKRTRPQKYQNRTSFKNTLHDKSDFQKKLNNLNVCEVCIHCKGVIEWKIKYKKYKPLTQPKTCIKCRQKTVKKAYHVMCRECALSSNCCAKCLKSSQEVDIVPAEPTEEEQLKLKAEMDKLIKSLPERKRRSFLRYMAKGKKCEDELLKDENCKSSEISPNEKEVENRKDNKRIPHSREALLKKIEELKFNEDENSDDDVDNEDEDDDSYDLSDEDEED